MPLDNLHAGPSLDILLRRNPTFGFLQRQAAVGDVASCTSGSAVIVAFDLSVGICNLAHDRGVGIVVRTGDDGGAY